jgi:hypothetical protein
LYSIPSKLFYIWTVLNNKTSSLNKIEGFKSQFPKLNISSNQSKKDLNYSGENIMPKYMLLVLLFICVFILTGSSGCIWNLAQLLEKLSSLEDSRQIALDYVRNLNSYRTCNLTEPVLIGNRPFGRTSCWQFVYEFDLVSDKDPSVIDTARTTVTVANGEILQAVYVQGSRHNP